MDYYTLRKEVSKIIPRMRVLQNPKQTAKAVKEKGRKKNYSQFNLLENKWVKQERLLNTEEVNSFLEISCRAAACPMPLNLDIWDGLLCPYGCVYCFPSGTKILMADGSTKNIERIKKGNRVMSFNEKTKQLEPATVTVPMKRKNKEQLICLETEDGKILKMTPEHPIYTQRGWIEAKDLKVEDEVFTW